MKKVLLFVMLLFMSGCSDNKEVKKSVSCVSVLGFSSTKEAPAEVVVGDTYEVKTEDDKR